MPVIFQDFQVVYKGGEIKYTELKAEDINTELFSAFRRHQVVEKCMRKIDGEWKAIDNPFVEDWGEKEYEYLVKCLISTVETGGVVFGAFQASRLVGFASAESSFFGSREQYLELSSIHVTEDLRGHGIGKKLFRLIAGWAKEKGGEKLYISSHSSVESQSFYKAVGCTEAEEYSSYHAEKEPCDCQLEFKLR
ncbi:MAG: GNAT family N-acetyltransferase [Oscillospiraceae bacterium]|nr:GNAT family N-acetyltransferase [Oscillospiraceae bacterium]